MVPMTSSEFRSRKPATYEQAVRLSIEKWLRLRQAGNWRMLTHEPAAVCEYLNSATCALCWWWSSCTPCLFGTCRGASNWAGAKDALLAGNRRLFLVFSLRLVCCLQRELKWLAQAERTE